MVLDSDLCLVFDAALCRCCCCRVVVAWVTLSSSTSPSAVRGTLSLAGSPDTSPLRCWKGPCRGKMLLLFVVVVVVFFLFFVFVVGDVALGVVIVMVMVLSLGILLLFWLVVLISRSSKYDLTT